MPVGAMLLASGLVAASAWLAGGAWGAGWLLVWGVMALPVGSALVLASRDQPVSLAVRRGGRAPTADALPRFGLDRFDATDAATISRIDVAMLREGKLRLDPCCDFAMDLRSLDWREGTAPTEYSDFNLHTLRFLVVLGELARGGDRTLFDVCRSVVLDWSEKNPVATAPRYHECFRGKRTAPRNQVSCYAWADEHAVAWRAIVLRFLAHVWRQELPDDRTFHRRLDTLIVEHAAYLCRQSNYRYEHNHGLNNALALVALGTTCSHLEGSGYWLGLGIRRAEQQMRDNVSSDGIHLEQSGFYHFYTLRSFSELLYGLQAYGHDLSAAYKTGLDRMFDAAVDMLDENLTVQGLPYSDPALCMRTIIDPSLLQALDLGDHSHGLRRYLDVMRGAASAGPSGLSVRPQGGFCFFGGTEGALRVVFHTRILLAGHAQQDAMGLSVRRNGQALVHFPSALRIPGASQWETYFHSSAAHNTVQVTGLAQRPLPGVVRDGLLHRLLHSYKIATLAWKTGTIDLLIALRRVLGADIIPLRERASSHNGEILAHGRTKDHAFVRARNHVYPGVAHTRTVICLEQCGLLVWDEMEAASEQGFAQTFHLGGRVERRDGGWGRLVADDGGVLASFAQLASDAELFVLAGQREPELAGWCADGLDEPVPIPTLQYRSKGRSARFVWLLAFGDEVVAAEWAADGSLVVGRTDQCAMRVRIRGDSVEIQPLDVPSSDVRPQAEPLLQDAR